MKKAYLQLENGAIFAGYAPFENQTCYGEVVFTTGMTGYTESLTDPSYTGQILVFTYPLIGNYGVSSSEYFESEKIHPKGVILSECAPYYSHFQGERSFFSWLEKEKIALLTDVDTRALTKVIREHGSLRGLISPQSEILEFPKQVIETKIERLQKKIYGKGKKRIILVDSGLKEGILRHLLSFSVEILRVPSSYDYSSEDFDAIVLSNGPGDPSSYQGEVAILKKGMAKKKPIFGICLGCQLMALAAGGHTYKLKYGHRGHNQPCIDLKTKKCYITSQNHGYAIDKDSLPNEWEVIFENLNDGSVEGIAHKKDPFFAVQFHPEACPGPTDTHFLFERFMQCL